MGSGTSHRAAIKYTIVDKASPIMNFKHPQVEGMLLRAIAWAAHCPADTLVNGVAPARGGGRGRRGQGGGEAPAAPGGRRGGQ